MTTSERIVEDDLDQAVRLTMDAVEHIRDDFKKPDDDWVPVCNLLGGAETVTLAFQQDFTSDAEKDEAVASAQEMARMLGSKYAVFVSSAWYAMAFTKAEADRIAERGVSKSEKRVECVVLVGMSKDRHVNYMADIIRDEVKPPTLGPWRKSAESTGRFHRIAEALS